MFGLRHGKIFKKYFFYFIYFYKDFARRSLLFVAQSHFERRIIFRRPKSLRVSDELFFVAQNWSRKTLSDDVLSSRKSLSREVTLGDELFFVAQNLVAQDFERRCIVVAQSHFERRCIVVAQKCVAQITLRGECFFVAQNLVVQYFERRCIVVAQSDFALRIVFRCAKFGRAIL